MVQFSLWLYRAARVLWRGSFRSFNLVVESLERLLHGGNAFLELVALLEEQSLAGADGAVALLEQSHIFDERLNLQTGRTHTFNKLDPAARGLVVIADAAFRARYRRDQPMRS